MEITEAEARELVRRWGLRGLPLTTLDETYYFEGPQEPSAEDVFGNKPNKRPWVLIHQWAGYGPDRYVLNPAMAADSSKPQTP